MKKIVCLAAIAAMLTGCSAEPLGTARSSNRNVTVEHFTDAEGCRIYRFYDGGSRHYFVRCPSGPIQTITPQSCGKNCTKSTIVETYEDL